MYVCVRVVVVVCLWYATCACTVCDGPCGNVVGEHASTFHVEWSELTCLTGPHPSTSEHPSEPTPTTTTTSTTSTAETRSTEQNDSQLIGTPTLTRSAALSQLPLLEGDDQVYITPIRSVSPPPPLFH